MSGFVGDPVEVSREAMRDWNSDDLGKFVAVSGANGQLDLLIEIRARLDRNGDFVARFDLPTPMIKCLNGRPDVDTGGEPGFEKLASHRLRGGKLGQGREHKQRPSHQGANMRFLMLMIVLAFPVIDVLITLRFAQWTHVPAPFLLLAATVAGALLLRHERMSFRARTLAAIHGEQFILRGVLDSGRKVLAGVLLIVPGVISDLIALVLLMLPINVGNRFVPQPATAGRGTARRRNIEGDYRRLD